jgi:predicted outer membrane repeat protein
MRLLVLLLSCMVSLTLCSTARAITWNVPLEAPTIQAGIDSASAGDTVLVACGTYHEYGILMKSGVTLRSESGLPGCVTIDADSLNAVIYFSNVDSTASVEGFTITGGRSTYGGGMNFYASSPTISNCLLFGNSSPAYGGAMYLYLSSPTISGCTLARNSEENYSGQMHLSSSSPSVENTIIAFGVGGHAVHCSVSDDPTLTCCDIYGNEGGDWVSCIDQQAGINGNFSADPLFCDASDGDFHLRACSPCLDAPGCGLVGALGLGDCMRVWRVPVDAPTIQAGIDSAACGDTVAVAPGTYYEHDIMMKSGITVMSETGDPSSVTVDANSLGRVFYCENLDTTTVIAGFTIRGGDVLPDGQGGGMYCTSSSPCITDCIIEHCDAFVGGGLYLDQNSSPVLTGILLRSNTTTEDGAGVACFNGSSPTATSCVFHGNEATQAGGSPGGGGLYCNDSAPSLQSCTFVENVATGSYGGSSCFASTGASLTVENTIMAFGPDGCAVGCYGGGTATLSCCDVYGNTEGDWVSCIAGQSGSNGNFSADPLFCNLPNGDFHLAENSPCTDAPGCGLVGAHPVGCEPHVPGVVHVPSDAPTIQAGIDLACPGDTVIVAAGTYYEHDIVMKSGVTLTSETGLADCVIIDAESLGRVFYCQNVDSTAAIKGFTMTGGAATGSAPDSHGGGIYLTMSSPLISNCVVFGNSATGSGGGTYLAQSSPTISNCTLYGNSAVEGGGVYLSSSSPSMANSIVAFNIGGYGVSSSGSDPILTCCDIFGNTAGDWDTIADQADINGNFSDDPLFHDPEGGDFCLRWCSPCADAPGCGQVGALGVAPSESRAWHVPADAPTIQAGIDSADACDTVLVASGTYYEHDIVMKSGITLRSETGEASSVTIDAQSLGRVLHCQYVGSSTVIEGFTMTGGDATGSPEGSRGGGMYLDRSSPTISNCTVSGNSAAGGGGIYLSGHSDPRIADCTIAGNSADGNGGGMYLIESSPAISSSTVSGNSAGNYGGGMYLIAYSDPVIDGCTLSGNSSGIDGGGMYAHMDSDPQVSGCLFSENTAANYGGGTYLSDYVSTISNTTLSGNSAPWGGAMYLENSDAQIVGCVVSDNSADNSGGGVFLYSCSSTMSSCTLVGNSAYNGSSIYVGVSSLSVENTIIAFGGAGSVVYCAGDPPTLTCCDVFGNAGGDWVGCIAGQAGINNNFSDDPQFCGAGSGDLHLRPCSPCLNGPGCGLVGALGVGACPQVRVPDDAATIQAGIDLACPGDTVIVAAGTYNEHDIVMKPGITLRSETGLPDCVTIDAQSLGRIFYCENLDTTTTITGFTIRGGNVLPDGQGGGMYCTSSSPQITDCVIEDCDAYIGGGLYLQQNSSPGLFGVLLRSNTTTEDGAGVACHSGSSPTVTSCVFHGNQASGTGAHGGGLYCTGSAPSLHSCTFVENVATGGYGGSSCLASSGASLTVENTIMAFGPDGCAVGCYGGGTATLSCCDVYGNTDGDWVSCITVQAGINGNFSLDPLFRDRDGGNFHLTWCSPCLDASGCGLVGALGTARPSPVWHVPADAPTIQAGIDSAGCGDTVIVATGTYYEHDIAMKPGITLRSETRFPDCVTIDAQQQGRVFYFEDVDNTVVVEGFTLTRGEVFGNGGGLYLSNSSPMIRSCVISDCSASGSGNDGGGVFAAESSPTLTDCLISGNIANDKGGGVYCRIGGHATFERCVFANNSAPLWGSGLLAWYNSMPTIRDCTFYGNSGSAGGAVGSTENSIVTVENTIISFSPAGPGVYCDGTGSALLTCCDVYGNAGGDWVGCIAGQDSVNGNFSLDPLFHDPESGDFTLLWCSPCADAPGCGLVGALGLAPDDPRVWHVPADAPTIQAGIDSANVCEIVSVATGTYYEHDIVMKSGITLRSETGEASSVTIDADSLGRVFYFEDVDRTALVEGFTLTGGDVMGNGGGIYIANSAPTIRSCVISDCSATGSGNDGGGVYAAESSPVFTDCLFSGNTANDKGGGVYCRELSSPTFEWCVFSNNQAGGWGGGMHCYSMVSPSLRHCTFCGNSGSNGGGLSTQDAFVTVENTIIAFSASGEACYCDGTSDITLSCCDLYGNAGGDWVGCVAAQYGVNGNISEDPLFCDPDNGDFGLASYSSPCAPHTPPNWECDLIGAWPVGCTAGSLWEAITAITDVPDDQGGQVRVGWERHPYDQPETPVAITEYSVWRRIHESKDLRYPPGNWEHVLSVPALGESTYMTICPTLCDSTIAEGMCWTALYLIAHTDDPLVYYECDPDSGYSVDNLEPTAPQGLTAEYDGEAIVLLWVESPETDFNYYAVYRGDEETFPLGDPIGYSTEPTYTDSDLPGPGEYWYKITATDFSGNESDPSLPASASTTGITEAECLPTVFYLGPAIPNPFNPITELSYSIPAGSPPSRVIMRVYDATGREVTTLVDADQEPGEYRAAWDGRDHKGSEVSSGVYFYRICWHGKSQTRRMVLLK